MKKWRVLIVDDEYRIGLLIQKLIHQEDLGIKEVLVTDRGDKALEIMTGTFVDIMITDIRMPQISGLELIAKAKEFQKEIKVIVVSGYREFEYAHKALQYGVDDYLLKPINERELNDVLQRTIHRLLETEKQGIERTKLEEQILESRQIIKRDILKELIDEAKLEEEDLPVELEGDAYRGISIKLDSLGYGRQDKKQDKLIVDKIINMVEKKLSLYVEEVLICEKEFLQIYCLFNYKRDKSKEIKHCINQILTEIQHIFMGLEQYEVTIGVGLEKNAFSDIRFSIQESSVAVKNRLRKGTGRLIYASEFSISRKKIEDRKRPYMERFLQGVKQYKKEELEQAIHGMFAGYWEEEDVSWCYDVAQEIVELFFENLEIEKEELLLEKKRLELGCNHSTSLMQLKSVLRDGIGEILESTRNLMKNKSVRPIRQAKYYIEEHYKEKIVLEDLASLVDLNPIYFSVLFKNETGLNFSSYLTEVRMEKAKNLLCNTNETISAIAEAVGYKDARYFSQTFTKIVGIKPILYRRLHS